MDTIYAVMGEYTDMAGMDRATPLYYTKDRNTANAKMMEFAADPTVRWYDGFLVQEIEMETLLYSL